MDEPRNHRQGAGRGYEDSPVNARRLFAFAAGVVALVVVGVAGSAVVFHFFVSHQSLGPPASPFANERTLPPSPRLQTNAPADLAHYRAEQEKILQSYGWVDPPAGVVRIPIDRAMDLVLQRGFSVRSGAASAPANAPGEAPPPTEQRVAPTPVDGEGVR